MEHTTKEKMRDPVCVRSLLRSLARGICVYARGTATRKIPKESQSAGSDVQTQDRSTCKCGGVQGTALRHNHTTSPNVDVDESEDSSDKHLTITHSQREKVRNAAPSARHTIPLYASSTTLLLSTPHTTHSGIDGTDSPSCPL